MILNRRSAVTILKRVVHNYELLKLPTPTTMKNVTDLQWGKLPVSRTELEISTVLSCGQSFRWKNDGPDPDEWIGVFDRKLWILKQDNEYLLYKVITKEGIENPTPQACEESLSKYFQLEISLPELYAKWSNLDAKFAELTITDYRGIRMLGQDPIENLFCFICSSNNNIIRISQMVEKMCRYYGDTIGEIYGKIYYDFPLVEKLRGPEVEAKLRQEGFGYRAGFIANSATKIVENGGVEWVQSLKKLEYDEANKQLQTLPGIGRKVADCICLMSLGFPEAIPVDTHIHQLGKQYLPHLASVKSLTDKVYTEISDFFRNLYGEYSGWAHSVLFASTLRHLKTEKANSAKTSKKRKKADTKSVVSEDVSSSEKPVKVSKVAQCTVAKDSVRNSGGQDEQIHGTVTRRSTRRR